MERVVYDPPSGWRYGFPKVYAPLAGETLAETLIRDGYPARLAEFGAQHCGFSGSTEALDALLKPAPAGAETQEQDRKTTTKL